MSKQRWPHTHCAARVFAPAEAMADWEEIKSWSIWDMPLQPRSVRDVDLRVGTAPSWAAASARSLSQSQRGLQHSASARLPRLGASRDGIKYSKHESMRVNTKQTTKLAKGRGGGFVGSDMVLHQGERRLMNDGAVWTFRVTELGFKSALQVRC